MDIIKKIAALLLLFVFLFSCDNESDDQNRNSNSTEFLGSPIVNFSINLNAEPLFNDLKFNNTIEVYRGQGGGINGVIIYRISENDMRAYEATCPNHPIENCSALTIDGATATCPCNGNRYSIAGGFHIPDEGGETLRPLLEYRATLSNNIIRVSN